MNILSFDPSGNFTEGSGTTGWAYFKHGELTYFGDVKAKEYNYAEGYWSDVIDILWKLQPNVVVCETYALQAGKAQQQSWSQLETPQLIGVIRYTCFHHNIKFVGQPPMLKERFKDSVLQHMGIMDASNKIMGKRTNMHMRDAIRHGLYYLRYGGKTT